MPLIYRLAGAFIITYFLSRLALRLLNAGNKPLKIALAHMVSFASIALFVGLLRAYWAMFDFMAPVIYVAPQLFWLIFDIVRAVGRPLRSTSNKR